jgi:hypothetical protein
MSIQIGNNNRGKSRTKITYFHNPQRTEYQYVFIIYQVVASSNGYCILDQPGASSST